MSAAGRWFSARFAHPRLAALFVAGLAILLVGMAVHTLASPGSGLAATGTRLVVAGYLVALAGGAGYLSFAAFEFRDRRLR